MAEKIEDFIKNSQKTNSLEFYLQEIRKLAKAQLNSKSIKVNQSDEKTDNPSELRDKVQQSNVIESFTTFGSSSIGKLILFQYDPKLKDKLPYYDTFPLVFPFKSDGSSTLGMNLHYLPPYERARLMVALYSVINSKEVDVNSKLLITYKTLNESSKFVYFKPCIKRYLHNHIRSRLMVINPEKWNATVMMPLANFVKASDFKVWQDSVMKVTNG